MQMQAAASPPAPPPRRRVYSAVDPRCEWASTEEADTLVVDVSGFRKEELKVLYNTRRKLKVTGERQVGGAQWARFLKVLPVPRSCDAGAIRAKMDHASAQLYVILPKGSSSSSSSLSKGKQEEQQQPAGSSQSLGQQKGPDRADGLSGGGSQWSAQEDAGNGRIEEKEQRGEQAIEQRQDQVMAIQDLPRSGSDANAVKKDDGGDNNGESKRWWKKISVLHVLGFVLVLAFVGVGATVLYVMLL